MNVWGSGGAHKTYFKKIDAIIKKIFNQDINLQPKGVIDVGSPVDTSTPLLTVHAKSKESVDSIRKQIQECFNITNQNKSPLKIIYKIVS